MLTNFLKNGKKKLTIEYHNVWIAYHAIMLASSQTMNNSLHHGKRENHHLTKSYHLKYD